MDPANSSEWEERERKRDLGQLHATPVKEGYYPVDELRCLAWNNWEYMHHLIFGHFTEPKSAMVVVVHES